MTEKIEHIITFTDQKNKQQKVVFIEKVNNLLDLFDHENENKIFLKIEKLYGK